MSNDIDEEKVPSWLLVSGVILTIAYGVVACVAFGPWDQFLKFMTSGKYDQVGNFLAGVFGPVAFLWLIIGYFMQHQELRLQRRELREQREIGTKTQEAVTARLEREKAADEPELRVSVLAYDVGSSQTQYRITNLHGTAKALQVLDGKDKEAARCWFSAEIFSAQSTEFWVNHAVGDPFQFQIHYQTNSLEDRTLFVEVNGHGKPNPTFTHRLHAGWVDP